LRASFYRAKSFLNAPPILIKPKVEKYIIVYLAVSQEAIGVALVQEFPEQKPMYFVSRALQNVETRYQLVQKGGVSIGLCSKTSSAVFSKPLDSG